MIKAHGYNAFSHDLRTQFMNWSLFTQGAYQYAADAYERVQECLGDLRFSTHPQSGIQRRPGPVIVESLRMHIEF